VIDDRGGIWTRLGSGDSRRPGLLALKVRQCENMGARVGSDNAVSAT